MAITANPITASLITANRITSNPISAGGAICRNVSNFNGVDSYVQFDNDIVSTGDFEYRVTCELQDQSTIFSFSDGSAVYAQNFESSPVVSFRVRDQSEIYVYGGSVPYEAGKRVVITFKRVGDTFSVYVDEVTMGDRTFTTKASYNLSVLGDGIWPLNGVLLDCYGWLNGDSDTGVLTVDLPMDESSETTTVDYINRNGNTLYNATGYNITVAEECEGDASAWNDGSGWNDNEPWID